MTRVHEEAPHVLVEAVSTKPIADLPILIQDAVVAAGYRPSGTDSEGYEAEVFFTLGSYAGGQAHIGPSPCIGRWAIDLALLDPEAVAP